MIKYVDALKNSEAYKLIKKDIDCGELAHAYMVISPDAEVVAELFSLVACTVFCENDACLQCSTCSKILNGNHVDIKYINQLNENIKVDDVKELIDDTSLLSYEGKNKLYFIYSADKMNLIAQNKLLKTLEEPPKSVTIFLGVGRESAMLDTIMSRARKIYLDRFSEDVIYNEIYAETYDEKKARIASVCCDGMLGRASEIAKSAGYEAVYDETLTVLKQLKKSSDVASVLGLKPSLVDNLPIFLDTLSLLIRDMLMSKTNLSLVLSKHKADEIMELSQGYSERALGNILYLINSERKKLEANVTKICVLENLFFGILEVKYKCR
ncbi:MAG: hypothetical protein RR357_02295 [Clostridia bacterium]